MVISTYNNCVEPTSIILLKHLYVHICNLFFTVSLNGFILNLKFKKKNLYCSVIPSNN